MNKILNLDLDLRTTNALINNNIETVEQFLAYEPSDRDYIKGLGISGRDKVWARILAAGLLPDNAKQCLSDREWMIIDMRFNKKMSLLEVAKEFSVTQERIRQIESKTIRKLDEHYQADYPAAMQEYRLAAAVTVSAFETKVTKLLRTDFKPVTDLIVTPIEGGMQYTQGFTK